MLPHCSLRFEVSATIQRRVCEGLKEIARIDIEIEEGVRGARVTSMSQGARAACCRRLGDSGLGSTDFVRACAIIPRNNMCFVDDTIMRLVVFIFIRLAQIRSSDLRITNK